MTIPLSDGEAGQLEEAMKFAQSVADPHCKKCLGRGRERTLFVERGFETRELKVCRCVEKAIAKLKLKAVKEAEDGKN